MIRPFAAATAALALPLLMAIGPAAAADAVGTWSTEGGKARVRIAHCGSALCGAIISLREPNDPQTGRPKTDKRNADPAKRSRPLIGVQVVLGMKPGSTAGHWNGKVYNAEDGKTYTGSITLVGDNALKLQGCVMMVLCKSQTWTRTR